MHTEIEAKFINIDLVDFRLKLRGLDATLISPERLMKRKNFDFKDSSLGNKNAWVRVRDEGDKVTLSYKQLNDRTLHGTKEINVVVDNFEITCTFLETIGLERKTYQETRRESWLLNDVEIEIDTWPWVPSFIELEAKTELDLKHVATSLGLDLADALHGSVEVVYQKYFHATEDEIDNLEQITFAGKAPWPRKS